MADANAAIGFSIPTLLLMALGLAAYLRWGWRRLGSEGIVARERARLAVQFALPCLAMTAVALGVAIVRVASR